MPELDVLSERLERIEKAIAHQAKEYERRLGELNHSHKLAQQKESQFVVKEVYNNAREEYYKFRDEVKLHISQSDTSRATWAAAIALIISLAGIWLNWK